MKVAPLPLPLAPAACPISQEMLGVVGLLLLLLVDRLALEVPVRRSVPFRPNPEMVLVEGDVVMPVTKGGGMTKNAFLNDPSNLWSNGVVFYRFETFKWEEGEKPIFDEQQIDSIRTIFQDIKREIPYLKFVYA